MRYESVVEVVMGSGIMLWASVTPPLLSTAHGGLGYAGGGLGARGSKQMGIGVRAGRQRLLL